MVKLKDKNRDKNRDKNSSLVKYNPNTKTYSSRSKQVIQRKTNSIGRVDVLASRFLGVLINGACSDLGMQGLAQELQPMIEQRMKPLRKIEIAPEFMAIGKAVMQKSRQS